MPDPLENKTTAKCGESINNRLNGDYSAPSETARHNSPQELQKHSNNEIAQPCLDASNNIQTDDSQTALEWCAVLQSQNIEFELSRGNDDENSAWSFTILNDKYDLAEREIRDYESERDYFLQFKKLSDEPIKPLRLEPAMPIIALSAILAAFHYVTGSFAEGSGWFPKGELSTANTAITEWWRPITALTLHADAPHILGNAIFAVFLGGMLAVEIGGGAVLFLALLTGVLGNITSLWINSGRGYSAVGFSTAVFGLLGVLAALRMRSQLPLIKRLTLRYWLPLGAAVALLGLTGTGPGSDLTAHFFGFFWGCVLGYSSANLAKHHENHLLQTIFAATTFAAIAAAWIAALT